MNRTYVEAGKRCDCANGTIIYRLGIVAKPAIDNSKCLASMEKTLARNPLTELKVVM